MNNECFICGKEDNPEDYVSLPIQKLMVEKHCCFSCAYWFNRPKENIKGDLIPVIVNGGHWSFRRGENISYTKVTFNKYIPVGEYHYILFEDGQLTIVTQLRFQGHIPRYFKEILPNNAVFINEVEYKQILDLKINKNVAPASVKCPQPLLNSILKKYDFTK